MSTSIIYSNTAGFEASLREMYRPLGEDELLEKALDVLREEGWIQGALHDIEGHACAVGALNKAATGRAEEHPSTAHRNEPAYRAAVTRLEKILKRMGVDTSCSGIGMVIPDFNDASSTTFEDVTLLFKHAIAEQGEAENDGTT